MSRRRVQPSKAWNVRSGLVKDILEYEFLLAAFWVSAHGRDDLLGS